MEQDWDGMKIRDLAEACGNTPRPADGWTAELEKERKAFDRWRKKLSRMMEATECPFGAVDGGGKRGKDVRIGLNDYFDANVLAEAKEVMGVINGGDEDEDEFDGGGSADEKELNHRASVALEEIRRVQLEKQETEFAMLAIAKNKSAGEGA